MAARDPAKAGHILFLVPCPQDEQDAQPRPAFFELEIPLDQLRQLVVRPVRWLRLVAWGLLNCTGVVMDANNDALNEDLLLDQLPVLGTYTFVPDNIENSSLLNFEHLRTRRTEYSSAFSDTPESSLTIEEALLAARDGGKCVFTGGDPIEKAHIIPKLFGRHHDELEDLATVRGFAFSHHLDVRNTVSLAGDIHTVWDLQKKVFILATDPAFVRKQDIPPPSIPLAAVANSPTRFEPIGETYVLQTLDGLLNSDSNLRKYVPFNTSARFTSPSPSTPPCPRAVNYAYAASMVELYRRPHPGLERLLSRQAVAGPSTSHPANAQEAHDGAPHVGRRGSTHHDPPRTRSQRRPHTPADLTPLEKLYLLADAPVLQRSERLQQHEDEITEETKGIWLQEWRAGSAIIHPSCT